MDRRWEREKRGTHCRRARAALIGVALGASGCAIASPPPAPIAATTTVPPPPLVCPERPDIVTLDGPQELDYPVGPLPDGSAVDARTATWNDTSSGQHPIHFHQGEGAELCWLGGSVLSNFSFETTPWTFWHNQAGMRVRTPGFTVEALRVDNEGDGIGFSTETANDWTVRGVHLSRIHDDCIENDYMHNGLVEDSLLDGCYVAFSARNSDGTDGHLNTETIRSSLVRLQPMPTVYSGGAPGHGGFFKWPTSTADGVGPNLVIENTIFRVDQLPNHGSLGLPDPPVGLSCANNVIVWLGAGPYPAALPSCFTITTEVAVWDDAVAGWAARHPATT